VYRSFLKEQEESGNKEAFQARRVSLIRGSKHGFPQADARYVMHGNVHKLALAKKE
jgi:hypothetical protein